MDRWPQKEVKMRGGRTAKWPLVNTPAGASLDLVWENITHAEAEQLAAVWDANYGLYGAVALDAATLAGLGSSLATLIQQPFPGCEWRAQSPPVIESVKAGRCTVRLPLRTRPGVFGGTPLTPSVAPQAITITVQTLAPSVFAAPALPVVPIVVAALAPEVYAPEVVFVPAADVAVAVLAPALNAMVEVPAASIDVQALVPTF